MNKIYRKLAFQNIKNNKSLYIPYIITSSVTIFMYYIFLAMKNSPDILNSRGGYNIATVLGLGEFVITLFSVIFLIYTNKFLVRNRDRELGLMNMLGIDKKGISKIMIYENLILTFLNIVIGIATSIIFSSVIFLLIGKALSITLTNQFYVHIPSIIKTILVYLAIFLIVLIGNIRRMKKFNPLDLLKESEKGEREPKASKVLTIVGIICILVGYYLANSTENVVEAMYIFLIAVVLVIIGTYLLFTTISIAVLKLLKKNKKVYYKSSNMTFISSLIFRMKQNAVSLANICILSTMVLVMLVSTTSLIASKNYFLKSVFPKDIIITYYNDDEAGKNGIKEILDKTLEERNLKAQDYGIISSLKFSLKEDKDGNYKLTNPKGLDLDQRVMTVFDVEEYNKNTGKNIELENGEALLYSNKGKKEDNIKIGDYNIKVKENLKNVDGSFKDMVMDLFETNTLFVKDKKQFYSELSKQVQGNEMAEGVEKESKISFNLKGEEVNINNWAGSTEKTLREKYDTEENSMINFTNRYTESELFVSLHSGIFVVTIFLSVLFMIATIMIIYYKQISEGMEDAKDITILKKIGMSDREIKKNLSKQMRVIFFAPLLISVIHLIGASSIVYNIMRIIGIGNRGVFTKATIVTTLVYSIIYLIIFKITSNSYYKVIKKAEKSLL